MRRYTKALDVDELDPDSADGRMGGRSVDGSRSYAAVLKYGGPGEATEDAIEAAVDAAVSASEAAVAAANALHAARDGAPVGGFMSGLTFFIGRQNDDNSKGALVRSIRAHGGNVLVAPYDAARVTHVVIDVNWRGDPPHLPSAGSSTLVEQVAGAARDQKAVVTWRWVETALRERRVLPLPLMLRRPADTNGTDIAAGRSHTATPTVCRCRLTL